jgi:thiamine-phosphate pyrophosphorylase
MTGRESVGRLRIHVLTDARLSRGRSHAEVVRAAIAGGADVIQFREKQGSGRALYEQAVALRRICREAGVWFIVNDRADLALAVDADGVHVGQEDLPARAARRLMGPDRVVGVSARDAVEAVEAWREGADYIGLGPVFDALETKPDAGAAVGLGGLSRAAKSVPIPVIAIGGITPGNAAAALRAGAGGVAVISCVVSADDVSAAVRALRAACGIAIPPGRSD